MIGIFDSGIGGLTVVNALTSQLPGYDYTYFGDTARTPYGTKSHKTVINYSIENSEFLLDKGAKIIVMACNTASSVASHIIAEKFKVPVFEVITPAVNQAVKISKKQSIGVIGTRGTVNSGIYKEKIEALKDNARVYSEGCPLLVPLVEEGWLDRPETKMIVKKYLHPLKVRQIDTLILGCTHYPVLKDLIKKKVGKNVEVVDSSETVAKSIKEYLTNNPETDASLGKDNKSRIYVSDVTDQFAKMAGMILKRKIFLETRD